MKALLRRALRVLAVAIAAGAGGARADSITVTHWGSAFYGAPYAVAMEKGFFKKYGVDITGVLTSQGGGTSVRNTLAGDLPYGEVALAAAVEAINNGVPLRIIGSGAQSIADILWMAKKGSPLHSIEDLVGKKVAFTAPGSVTNMLILMSMKKKAIDPSAVKLVPAGGIGANVSAVLNNAVDAGMCGEPVWSENEDKLQPVFWPKDILSPNMMQTVAVTTADYATRRRGQAAWPGLSPDGATACATSKLTPMRPPTSPPKRSTAIPLSIAAYSPATSHPLLVGREVRLRRHGPHG